MKKLFVSLPMAGLPVETIRKRQLYYKRLTELYLGEEVELIDTIANTHDYRDRLGCLGESICKMSNADIVFLAKEWQYSNGCQVEEKAASLYGIEIYTEESILSSLCSNYLKDVILKHDSYEDIDNYIWDIALRNNTLWIPVSEQLPDKDGSYLVTYTPGLITKLYFSKCLSDVDAYDFPVEEGYKRPGWYEYDSEYGHYEYENVTAWMELPRPYLAEVEE